LANIADFDCIGFHNTKPGNCFCCQPFTYSIGKFSHVALGREPVLEEQLPLSPIFLEGVWDSLDCLLGQTLLQVPDQLARLIHICYNM
jgi:hypothetical protein